MTYRIFMKVNRGMTDETAVCVFPWEKQLLEEVHGTGAELVTIDQMCSKDGVASVKPIKMPTSAPDKNGNDRTPDKAPTLREQLEVMTRVKPDADPFADLATEWGRLMEKYGMHPDVQVPIAEKVFGTMAQWRRLIQPYRGLTKPPRVDPIDGADDEDLETGTVEIDEDRAPADMNRDELKAALKARNVDFRSNAPDEKLVELLTDAIAGEPA